MRFSFVVIAILAVLASGYARAETVHVSMAGPQLLALNEDAASVIVGNPAHVAVVMDTPRTMMIVPKAPGMTRVIAIGRNGNVLFNEAVIVGGPEEDFIRIQNACINGGDTCQQFQTYYCEPGERCHNVGMIRPAASGGGGNSGSGAGAPPVMPPPVAGVYPPPPADMDPSIVAE